MKDLHFKYPKEHLEYAQSLAYSDDLDKGQRCSYSTEIAWNDLSNEQKGEYLEKAKIGFFIYLQLDIESYRKQFANSWNCPVCNFILHDAPEDHEICTECWTHFDYEDSAYTVDEMKQKHFQLREKYERSKE